MNSDSVIKGFDVFKNQVICVSVILNVKTVKPFPLYFGFVIAWTVLIGIGVGAVIGATVGSIYGYKTAKKLNIAKNNQWKLVVRYAVVNGIIKIADGWFKTR